MLKRYVLPAMLLAAFSLSVSPALSYKLIGNGSPVAKAKSNGSIKAGSKTAFQTRPKAKPKTASETIGNGSPRVANGVRTQRPAVQPAGETIRVTSQPR